LLSWISSNISSDVPAEAFEVVEELGVEEIKEAETQHLNQASMEVLEKVSDSLEGNVPIFAASMETLEKHVLAEAAKAAETLTTVNANADDSRTSSASERVEQLANSLTEVIEKSASFAKESLPQQAPTVLPEETTEVPIVKPKPQSTASAPAKKAPIDKTDQAICANGKCIIQ
jgi:hypothetical protein